MLLAGNKNNAQSRYNRRNRAKDSLSTMGNLERLPDQSVTSAMAPVVPGEGAQPFLFKIGKAAAFLAPA